jgi:hypothetical protein
MADYQFGKDDSYIRRNEDSAHVPNAEGNRDWVAYQKWLADGGVPDPYVPPPEPQPPAEHVVLLDHENRIRSMEGQPPITMEMLHARMTRR